MSIKHKEHCLNGPLNHLFPFNMWNHLRRFSKKKRIVQMNFYVTHSVFLLTINSTHCTPHPSSRQHILFLLTFPRNMKAQWGPTQEQLTTAAALFSIFHSDGWTRTTAEALITSEQHRSASVLKYADFAKTVVFTDEVTDLECRERGYSAESRMSGTKQEAILKDMSWIT